MTRKMDYGKWAHVVGSFDLATKRGAITSMQPATVAYASLEGGEERVRLKGFDVANNVLFDLPVNPLIVSCGPVGDQRTFEEYVAVTDELAQLRLFVDGVEASEFSPGRPPQPRAVRVGPPRAAQSNRLPVQSKIEPTPNVSYTVQVRPDGDPRWHTMAVGLVRPDASEIDVNQFSASTTAIDIRILQSDGLTQKEIFRERREF